MGEQLDGEVGSTTPDDRTQGGGRAAVQRFLDGFARALTAGDVEAIAKLWDAPAFVLSDEDGHAVGSLDEVRGFFGGAKAQYTARGITDTRPQILRLEWPTERIAVVEVRWPYLDARGTEIGAERSTYTLRRDAGGELKLRVALMQGVEAASATTTH